MRVPDYELRQPPYVLVARDVGKLNRAQVAILKVATFSD